MIKKFTGAVLVLLPFINAVAEEPTAVDKEKFSYSLGRVIGENLQKQGANIDMPAFTSAVEAALKGEKSKYSEQEMQAIIQKQQESNFKSIATKNLDAGKQFREENKKKEGVKELPNGLQYKVITEGKGEKPKATDIVSVNYKGSLVNGTEFDSSERAGGPATFQLDKVIRGWQEILPLMPAGSKWNVVIPPDLAYGENGAGGVIGPNETLVFDIEYLGIKKAEANEATPATTEEKPK